MTWRLAVRHVTGYQYPRQVQASYNEARMTPLSTGRQLTVAASLDVKPRARINRYWDYWGSMVHSFDLHSPHDELVVTASSVVETMPPPDALDSGDASWDVVSSDKVRDAHYEYLAPTSRVPADPELLDIAAELRSRAGEPRQAVGLAAMWVREQVTYEKGTTNASTSAIEAWRVGRGVCQDIVHLSLAMLRAMGIPARYVSGYFHPDARAELGQTVVGESHAWAEAWVGGWTAFDPTNDVPVGERHVVVGRARDYADVAPLRGVYSGAPSSTPTVSVDLTRQA